MGERAQKTAQRLEQAEETREKEIKERPAKLQELQAGVHKDVQFKYHTSKFTEEVFTRLGDDEVAKRKETYEQRSRFKKDREEETMKLATAGKATRPRSKDPHRELYIQGIAKARRQSEKRREKE